MAGRRQVFHPGELPLVLLHLLAERPRRGNELLKELRHRLEGVYEPSPGSVYPALAALRAEGLVVEAASRRDGVYEATAAGRRLLRAKAPALADIAERVSSRLLLDDDVSRLLDQLASAVRASSARHDRAAVHRILTRAVAALTRLESAHG